MADRAVDDELVKFRVANGYAASEILSRDYRDSAFVYTVRFKRQADIAKAQAWG